MSMLTDMSSIIERAGALLLNASIAGAVVALLLLLARVLLRDRAPGWAWGTLWLVVLVRLLTPWAPASTLSLHNAPRWMGLRAPVLIQNDSTTIDQGTTPTDAAAEPIALAPIVATPSAVRSVPSVPPSDTHERSTTHAATAPLDWPLLTAAVWLAGAALVAWRIVAAWLYARRVVAISDPVVDPDSLRLLEACRRAMGIRRVVALRVAGESTGDAAITGPCVAGVLQPVIVLARGGVTLDIEDLRAVLLHELAHIRRHDLVTGWVWGVALAIHWFNPLAWLAAACMRRDRELACDQAAIQALQESRRLGYARTLVKLAEQVLDRAVPARRSRPALFAALVGIGPDQHEPGPRARAHLFRRCSMITRFRPASKMQSALIGAALCVVAVVNLTAPVVGAAPKVKVVDSDETAFELYFKPYEKNQNGHVAVPNVELMAMPEYHGASMDGQERTIDKRFTLVVQDRRASFWPVIMRLSKKDANALFDKLDQAAKTREDAQAFAKRLSRGDAAKEAEVLAEMLKSDRERGPAVLNMRHGEIALKNDNMATLPAGARLEVKMPGEMDHRTTIWINGAPDGAGWYTVVYADQTTIEKLRDQMAGILRRKVSRAADAGVTGSEIKTRLLIGGLKLNEYGYGEIATNSSFKVQAIKDSKGAQGARLSLINGASGQPVAEAVLDRPSVFRLASDVRMLLAQRDAGGSTTRGTMTAGVATKPYEIGEGGIVELPTGLMLRALPQYNGVNLDGTEIVDKRITIVADDNANHFWPILARVDDDIARKLADDLDATMK